MGLFHPVSKIMFSNHKTSELLIFVNTVRKNGGWTYECHNTQFLRYINLHITDNMYFNGK